jgi:molybdopterin synthase sulfur carrier subunit
VSSIRLPTVLRPAASGQAVVAVEGTTIRQLLEALQAEYPAMSGQVLTTEGDLHRFVNVYLNDDDVRYLRQLDTPVGPDDVVSILPAVAGGVG